MLFLPIKIRRQPKGDGRSVEMYFPDMGCNGLK